MDNSLLTSKYFFSSCFQKNRVKGMKIISCLMSKNAFSGLKNYYII